MKIAIAQINLILGDLDGNVAKLVQQAEAAHRQGAALIVTPELALCGYPPEDLLFRHDFRLACQDALARLAAQFGEIGIPLVVAHPHLVRADDGRERL
ncbi:MAG: nitrilase-related carbon-nitrogen hydrolase, partial [Burkholderiales bacterium]